MMRPILSCLVLAMFAVPGCSTASQESTDWIGVWRFPADDPGSVPRVGGYLVSAGTVEADGTIPGWLPPVGWFARTADSELLRVVIERVEPALIRRRPDGDSQRWGMARFAVSLTLNIRRPESDEWRHVAVIDRPALTGEYSGLVSIGNAGGQVIYLQEMDPEPQSPQRVEWATDTPYTPVDMLFEVPHPLYAAGSSRRLAIMIVSVW